MEQPHLNLMNAPGYMPMAPGYMGVPAIPPMGAMNPGLALNLNPKVLNSQSTLYVGNLHPELKEMELFSLFNPFGKINSVRIMKNTYTGESRCFGFVTFEKVDDAKAAQERLNNSEFMMREIRVYFKKNLKVVNPDKNFVIKNLDKSVSSRQLAEEVSKYGNVISCFVKKDEVDGKLESLGYGYVQFDDEANTANFVSNFNGTNLNGKEILVEQFVPSNKRERPENKNLYLKQFPSTWNQTEVEGFIDTKLGEIGTIASKGVFIDKKLNKFYAFVAFENSDDAKKVVDTYNNKVFIEGEEPLYVGFAQSKAKRRYLLLKERINQKNETNMYIKSIKPEVSKDEIERIFSKYGTITSICIKEWQPSARPQLMNPEEPAEPKKLKFGFINYEKPEDAMKLFTSYKADKEIRDLVDVEHEHQNFIFFAQSRKQREQYLRMQKKNAMEYQMMKMYQMQNMRNPNFKPRQKMPYPKKGIAPPMNMMPNALHSSLSIPQPMPQMLNTPSTSFNTTKQSISQEIEKCKNVQNTADIIKARRPEFDALNTDEKKNILGNLMYERVKSKHNGEPEQLPKITGMLIDLEVLDLDEILEIIANDEVLQERIEEAIEVLVDSG